jgi:hypothetical protein
MNKKIIWSHLEDGFDILGGYGYPMMDKTAEELNLDDDWFSWIAAIWLFGSEPITTAKFMKMFPYGLARLNEECFASAARQGYLMLDTESGYSPTEIGINVAQKIWRQAGVSLADLKPMPEKSLQHIFNFLERLVEASLATPEPPYRFYLSHKKNNYQRLGTVYPLEIFVVLFGELSAYRDDMHIATWQAYQVEGHAWDMFDKIYSEESLTIDGMYAKLKRRGLLQDIYIQDLQELIERGWVIERANEYQITPAGKKIREDVEAETERFFFAPWSCLDERDLEYLMNLSTQLHDGLQNPKEKT